jgi:hypothetical protein
MAESNGALKAANGFTNGKAKPAGKPAAAGKRRGVVKRRGFLSWLFNQVAWFVNTSTGRLTRKSHDWLTFAFL